MDVAYSKNYVPIRLPEERWDHIILNKEYMSSYRQLVLETIQEPTWILRGYGAKLVAVLSLPRKNYLNVVYKEINQDDGFIITAFLAKKVNRRMIIWPKKP